jgi:hypothetical protein
MPKFPGQVAGHINLVGTALSGFLFWGIAWGDLTGRGYLLHYSSEYLLELLPPPDEEDRRRNPFVIVPRPSTPPTVLNHPEDFSPLYGPCERQIRLMNKYQSDVVRLTSRR